jgi:uncharacterized protein DUF222
MFEDAHPDPLDELDRIELERRKLDARMYELLIEADRDWPDGAEDPELACEMAARQRISSRTAWEHLRIARALSELPHLRRAQREGTLSRDQLRWLTKFVKPDTDQEWASRGASLPPWRLREESERQRKIRAREAEDERASRRVSMSWDEERRNLEIHATLPGEQGELAERALTEGARHIPLDESAEDPHGARLADSLTGLLAGPRGSGRPTLVVHADVRVLKRNQEGVHGLVSETASGIQVSHESVRRIACGANVEMVLQRDGRPAQLARVKRFASPAQERALRFRDRHCSYPGCESTWQLVAHHIIEWPDGPTTLQNLTTLCAHHHHKVHEGKWTIRGEPPDLEFFDPRGRPAGRASPVLPRAG